jgi:hypothetical protein
VNRSFRHTIARDLAALFEYEALSLRDAAARILARLEDAATAAGSPCHAGVRSISLSTPRACNRGAADACGRFEVAIHAERRGRSRRA